MLRNYKSFPLAVKFFSALLSESCNKKQDITNKV